jgi:hypothetical protein
VSNAPWFKLDQIRPRVATHITVKAAQAGTSDSLPIETVPLKQKIYYLRIFRPNLEDEVGGTLWDS